MAQRIVTIGSAVGLHARPASLFVRAATATGLHVTIARDGADTARPCRRRQHPGRHGPRSPPRRAGRAAGRRRRRGRRPGRPRRTAVARPGPRRVSPAPFRRQHYGIGVSPGAAVGPVMRMRPPRPTPAGRTGRCRPGGDGAARARGARRRRRRPGAAGAAADATVREILEATAMMARDPGLASAVDDPPRLRLRPGHRAGRGDRGLLRRVRRRRWLPRRARHRPARRRRPRHRGPARAWTSRGCPDRRSRASSWPTTSRRPRPPALDPGRVLAIITEAGGALSHTAVLAAQLGIPAVVQLAAAPTLADGTLVAVDGGSGLVVVDPDPAYRAELAERRRTARQGLRVQPRAGAHPRRRGRWR